MVKYWEEVTERESTKEHEEIWRNTVFPGYQLRLNRAAKVGRRTTYTIDFRWGNQDWNTLEEDNMTKDDARPVARSWMRQLPFAGEAEDGDRHHEKKIFFDQADLQDIDHLEEVLVDIDDNQAGGGYVVTESEPMRSNNFTIYSDGSIAFDAPLNGDENWAVKKLLKDRGLN